MCVVAVLGKCQGQEGVFVVAHAVGKPHARMALVREEEIVVVNSPQVRPSLFVEEHVVETNAVALGIDVELANGIRLVACVAEGLGMVGSAGMGAVVLKTRSPWVRGEVPVIRVRRLGSADWAFAIGVDKAGAAAAGVRRG